MALYWILCPELNSYIAIKPQKEVCAEEILYKRIKDSCGAGEADACSRLVSVLIY